MADMIVLGETLMLIGQSNPQRAQELFESDFKNFYMQYDQRRNKNFTETFPMLRQWFNGIEVDQTIPDVSVTDGRITHFESGVYVSDKENYNK